MFVTSDMIREWNKNGKSFTTSREIAADAALSIKSID